MKHRNRTHDWAPGRPKYQFEEARKAARVQATLRSRAKNKERYNTYMSNYQRELYKELRKQAIELLGGPVCCHCKYDKDVRALQIDHINGGGQKERKNRWKLYKTIVEHPELYQILCANCNQIKKFDNNEGWFVEVEADDPASSGCSDTRNISSALA